MNAHSLICSFDGDPKSTDADTPTAAEKPLEALDVLPVTDSDTYRLLLRLSNYKFLNNIESPP